MRRILTTLAVLSAGLSAGAPVHFGVPGVAWAQPAPAAPAASPEPTQASARPASAAEAPSPGPPPPPKRPALPQSMGMLQLETGAVGVDVFLDGEPVGQTPLPGPWTLPPGRHRLELRPKDGPPVAADVMVSAGTVHRVPLLASAAPAARAPQGDDAGDAPADGEPQATGKVVHTGAGFSLKTAGYVSAGIGLAAGVTGAVLGIMANAAAADARDLDRANPANTRADQAELSRSAEGLAFGANVLYGVAAVGVASGALMLLFGRDGLLGGPVTVAPTPGGVGLGGVF